MGLRFAALLVGLIAALAPAALLAYDAGTSGPTAGVVAQATATATEDSRRLLLARAPRRPVTLV